MQQQNNEQTNNTRILNNNDQEMEDGPWQEGVGGEEQDDEPGNDNDNEQDSNDEEDNNEDEDNADNEGDYDQGNEDGSEEDGDNAGISVHPINPYDSRFYPGGELDVSGMNEEESQQDPLFENSGDIFQCLLQVFKLIASVLDDELSPDTEERRNALNLQTPQPEASKVR